MSKVPLLKERNVDPRNLLSKAEKKTYPFSFYLRKRMVIQAFIDILQIWKLNFSFHTWERNAKYHLTELGKAFFNLTILL